MESTLHLAELSPTQTSANRSLVRALKYMPALLLGPLALYEYSPAFCLIAVIASLMALAFASRIKSIEKQSHRHAPLARRLMGDGGSFPNTEAQQPQPLFRPPAVVDGGSMEHHRP
jgi:hypothetical protein